MQIMILAVAVMTSLTSIRADVWPVANGTKAQLVIQGESAKGGKVKYVKEIGSGPGSGSTKGWIMKGQQIAVVNMHQMNRVNTLIEVSIQNGKVVVDEDLNEHLFAKLPKRFRDKTVPDCVGRIRFDGGKMLVDFRTREERDGVKAKFERKRSEWVYRSAEYWRDPSWNGIRNF